MTGFPVHINPRYYKHVKISGLNPCVLFNVCENLRFKSLFVYLVCKPYGLIFCLFIYFEAFLFEN